MNYIPVLDQWHREFLSTAASRFFTYRGGVWNAFTEINEGVISCQEVYHTNLISCQEVNLLLSTSSSTAFSGNIRFLLRLLAALCKRAAHFDLWDITFTHGKREIEIFPNIANIPY